jgi:hypothetical protein
MPGLAGQKSAFISLVQDGICWGLGSKGTQKCFYPFLFHGGNGVGVCG